MDSQGLGVTFSTSSSYSRSTTSDQGNSSASFATVTRGTPEGLNTISSSIENFDSTVNSATAIAIASPDQAIVITEIQPVPNPGQIANDVPPQIIHLFPHLEIFRESMVAHALSQSVDDAIIGTNESQLLVGIIGQDCLVGYGGADIFMLSDVVGHYAAADVIVDFSIPEADRIGLPENITFYDLALQVIDLDGDTTPESTVIHLGATGEVFAIVLNTVNESGFSALSSEHFLPVLNVLGV